MRKILTLAVLAFAVTGCHHGESYPNDGTMTAHCETCKCKCMHHEGEGKIMHQCKYTGEMKECPCSK